MALVDLALERRIGPLITGGAKEEVVLGNPVPRVPRDGLVAEFLGLDGLIEARTIHLLPREMPQPDPDVRERPVEVNDDRPVAHARGTSVARRRISRATTSGVPRG
jgi:hypothetical protein